MMNNLLSFSGYQDGGLVFDDAPTFEDVVERADVSYADLPQDFLDLGYEYDPAREDYLSGKYGRAEEEMDLGLSGAYRGMTSSLRDIVSGGRETLRKMRTSPKGGFAGGGNLLDMTVEDLYSDIGVKREGAVGGYKDFEALERLKLAGTEADIREDVRTTREDYFTGGMEFLEGQEELHGEPFRRVSQTEEGCQSVSGNWWNPTYQRCHRADGSIVGESLGNVGDISYYEEHKT